MRTMLLLATLITSACLDPQDRAADSALVACDVYDRDTHELIASHERIDGIERATDALLVNYPGMAVTCVEVSQ